jgi:hypothetical protein
MAFGKMDNPMDRPLVREFGAPEAAEPQRKSLSEILAAGKARTEKVADTTNGTFRAMGMRLASLWEKTKTGAQAAGSAVVEGGKAIGQSAMAAGSATLEGARTAGHLAMATPELFATGKSIAADRIQSGVDKVADFAERVESGRQGIVDSMNVFTADAAESIDAAGERVKEWGAEKAQQAGALAQKGVEMTAAAALAAKDRSAEAIQNGVQKIGETYRGVRSYAENSIQFARNKAAEIYRNAKDAMERRRLAMLEAELAEKTAERDRLLAKFAVQQSVNNLAAAA